MNKKTAIALALGSAFAAPVFAQTTGSTIEIYGRLYPAFAAFKASDATGGSGPSNLVTGLGGGSNGDLKNRYSVDVYNSRIGFRGREGLGGGLSAIWQMEQRVRFDDAGAGFWASRDSFVGLTGGFGTLRLGIFDTIHNDYGNVTNFWGIKSGHFLSSTSVLTDSGLGTGGVGFDVRKSNSVKYETPEFGGFQAGLSWSPDEAKGNPGREGFNASLWAAAVKWSSGPLYLSAQYEQHNDMFDGSVTSGLATNAVPDAGSSKDRSMRVSARYSITPAHRLSGDIGRLQYEEDGPGLFRSHKKTVFQVGWEASWGGPWRSVVTFARAADGECELSTGDCSTEGLKTSQLSAGVAYDLSKRTFVYTGFARQSMGESALYDNWTNGVPPRGAAVTQWGVGVTHNF
jgi:predicted porin